MATDVPEPEDSRSEAQFLLERELEAIAAAKAEGMFFSFHDDLTTDLRGGAQAWPAYPLHERKS